MVYIYPPHPRSLRQAVDTPKGTVACHYTCISTASFNGNVAFDSHPLDAALSFAEFTADVLASPPSAPTLRLWTHFKAERKGEPLYGIERTVGVLVAYMAFHPTVYPDLDRYLNHIHGIEAARMRGANFHEIGACTTQLAEFQPSTIDNWGYDMDMPVIVECGQKCCVVPPYLVIVNSQRCTHMPLIAINKWLRSMHNIFHFECEKQTVPVVATVPNDLTRATVMVSNKFLDGQLCHETTFPLLPHLDLDRAQFSLLGNTIALSWCPENNGTLSMLWTTGSLTAKGLLAPMQEAHCVATRSLPIHVDIGIGQCGSITRVSEPHIGKDILRRVARAVIAEDYAAAAPLDAIPYAIIPHPRTVCNVVAWHDETMRRMELLEKPIVILPSVLTNMRLMDEPRELAATVVGGALLKGAVASDVWKAVVPSIKPPIPFTVRDTGIQHAMLHIPAIDAKTQPPHYRRLTETFMSREAAERTANRRVLVVVGPDANGIVAAMHQDLQTTHIDGTTGAVQHSTSNVVTISSAQELFKSYAPLMDNYMEIMKRRQRNSPVSHRRMRIIVTDDMQEDGDARHMGAIEMQFDSVAESLHVAHEAAGFLHSDALVAAGIHSSDILMLAISDVRFIQVMTMSAKEAESDASCHGKTVRGLLMAAANTLSSLRLWAPNNMPVPWLAYPAGGTMPHIASRTWSFGSNGVRFFYTE